ncbi:MAG TPA: trypsin-like peptidase domain-containing protein, partial [Armatimonadota bacterium]|nr:trypsin-like peptidase domain-containing protein [Armatimonadota bacterium]
MILVVLYGHNVVATVTPANAQADAAQLERSFVDIAALARPAVVNITAKSIQDMRGPGGGHPQVPEEWREFFEDPFFRPFRRDGEGGEGEEGAEEGAEEGGDEEGGPGAAPHRPFRMPARSMGSGWIYDEDGYIVTNSHVVKGATEIRVALYDQDGDDKQYKATVVGNDPRTELAVLKIDVDRKLPTLKIGSSDETKVGQWVMAVGSPFELEQTVTVGVVSAIGRQINPPDQVFRLGDIVQTDASINPGNSGGPLINLRGEVVGVNVAIVAPGRPGNVGIGFAIAAD